jgi:hypothetical protein
MEGLVVLMKDMSLESLRRKHLEDWEMMEIVEEGKGERRAPNRGSEITRIEEIMEGSERGTRKRKRKKKGKWRTDRMEIDGKGGERGKRILAGRRTQEGKERRARLKKKEKLQQGWEEKRRKHGGMGSDTVMIRERNMRLRKAYKLKSEWNRVMKELLEDKEMPVPENRTSSGVVMGVAQVIGTRCQAEKEKSSFDENSMEAEPGTKGVARMELGIQDNADCDENSPEAESKAEGVAQQEMGKGVATNHEDVAMMELGSQDQEVFRN